MATYNGERYLEEQLESLARQVMLPFELVACDDGSSDRTVAMLESFAERAPFEVRIRVNGQTLGPGENFLQTASMCSGDWIAFCDQDDVWSDRKLERIAEVLAAEPAVSMVSHSARQVNQDLQESPRLPNHPDHGRYTVTGPLRNPPMRALPGFSCVFSRSLFASMPYEDRPQHMTRPDELEPHDNFVYNVVNTYGHIARIPDVLALHRRHGSTVTGEPGTGIKRGYGGKKLLSRGARHARALDRRSDVAASYASYYRRRFDDADQAGRDDVWRMRTSKAIEYYDALGLAYGARADVHRPKAGTLGRLRALVRCVAVRAYGDHAGGRGIGRAAFFRDVAGALGVW